MQRSAYCRSDQAEQRCLAKAFGCNRRELFYALGGRSPRCPDRNAMRYRVLHSTIYEYPAPVTVSHHTARLHPRQDGHQRCRSFSLRITPHPALRTARYDFFGNQVSAFSIQEIHDRLEIIAISELEVVEGPPASLADSAPWEE